MGEGREKEEEREGREVGCGREGEEGRRRVVVEVEGSWWRRREEVGRAWLRCLGRRSLLASRRRSWWG